jgi:hypothetical protein
VTLAVRFTAFFERSIVELMMPAEDVLQRYNLDSIGIKAVLEIAVHKSQDSTPVLESQYFCSILVKGGAASSVA